MPVSEKNAKILWANAAGRCSFPNCRIRLTADPSRSDQQFTLGEMAHIKGERARANRYDPDQSSTERNAYGNLILLCPNHHTLIDKPENEEEFSVEKLLSFKAQHEALVRSRLDGPHYATRREVARAIIPLLRENHEVFLAYGPHSEIARRNPQSDAHALWVEERLATIVPNNRAIAALIAAHRNFFEPQEGRVISRFLQHVRSYEKWISEDLTYEGVTRFPVEFDELIESAAQ
jgi:hypothetical protein